MNNKVNFLRELTALTRRYGIAIGGCGCCGSPWLDDKVDVSSDWSGYAIDDTAELTWVAPSDTHAWTTLSEKIVR